MSRRGWLRSRVIIGVAVLTWCLLAQTQPAFAADPPISLEAYRQKLAETRDLVVSLEPDQVEANQGRLQALADDWAGITSVTLADRSIVTVDHSYLVAQLRATPPNLGRLSALLTTLSTAALSWPAPRHSAEDVARLAPILDRAEFQWQQEQPSLLDLLFDRLLRAIINFLSRFVPENTLISLNAQWVSYLITATTVLALLLILIYLSRSILAEFSDQAGLNPDQRDGDEPLTAESALKKAQTLSSGGDYRTAVRYLYLSSLLLLDERGLLRYDRSRTNREYLRSVAHLPRLAAALRDVIDIFDRVWYGYQPLDESTYSRYEARVAELRVQKK
ncbi:MAG: DUF4129 domain-containing protein [Anaerolineae bacterium]|nr:DUF4129 domain-containing protein [Anaerolineae bacterium]